MQTKLQLKNITLRSRIDIRICEAVPDQHSGCTSTRQSGGEFLIRSLTFQIES
ncbi:MAG: hypothetical protein ACXW18_04190 [Pyrinomonadaceae bacterium]